jgi:DNA-binding MarR family transcriptional regulator
MSQNNEALVQRILRLAEGIYNSIPLTIPVEWLSSDITVAQLRVLLVLQAQVTSRMSSIASELGIALPTATGIIDNLVKKGLVVRDTDDKDRRLVICKLSPEGQSFINKLWLSGQSQIENLFDGLTSKELRKVADVAQILFDNASQKFSKISWEGAK